MAFGVRELIHMHIFRALKITVHVPHVGIFVKEP